MTLVVQAQYGVLSPGENHLDLTPKVRPATPKPGVVNLHGAGGDAYSPIGWLRDGKPGTPNFIAANGNNSVANDAGGPQTWGSQAGIDGAQRAYNRVQALPGTKTGKVFLLGASMGGLTCLNWAAANPDKVAGIILILPVINVNDIRVNNRGGYAGLIDAAHGTYNEGTMGSTKNPQTMAGLGKYSGIPILLFYGQTDTICVPGEAVAFANTVGPNVTLVALNSGHDDVSYRAVSNTQIINFINTNS